MSKNTIVTGQRYITTSEPALGLGLVISEENGLVEMSFSASEDVRTYAIDSAPLVRVRFAPGDEIYDAAGSHITVEKLTEKDHLITYHAGPVAIHETDLADTLSFIRPEKRLLAGLADSPRAFEHRLEALRWNAAIRRSPARGYTGARIDLIPHQLAIAAEAANRAYPRILLADEVGLGKTIEACLILQRLHLTGRADRILILVPEPLVHQWFIELLRRFNLLFSIFDSERLRPADTFEDEDENNDSDTYEGLIPGENEEKFAAGDEVNPFLESQLILCATEFLTENPDHADQARAAGFDLLIVDEAHHLAWSENDPSPAYSTVESFATKIPSVLLLTATPQQLGPEGHFARLRLLDPARYSSLEGFLEETECYTPLALAIETLAAGKIPEEISSLVEESPYAKELLEKLKAKDESAREPLIRHLVDSFGTGRAFFRNTRERLTGFPKRLPILHPLSSGTSPYDWLASLLRELPESEKVLLITSSPEAAITIQDRLASLLSVKSALFHEELTLLQRDRNAAYFAEAEGARILICSEIGSEGRNFQFARHLVLFGLPRDPEVLEQRIGRLDRIGQTGDISIHVPYGENSKSELQARWLHEALDAFSEPLKGATTLAFELLPLLDEIDVYEDLPNNPDIQEFFKKSRAAKAAIQTSLASGHDKLLELGAPSPDQASDLLEAIEEADADPRFQRFALRLFDHMGLDVKDLSAHSFVLKRGQRQSDALADIPDEGLSITFDRLTAISMENLSFMTLDHPALLDSVHQLLSGPQGNASFARLQDGKGSAIFLECAFVLETLAPQRLQLDRFLPPTLCELLWIIN